MSLKKHFDKLATLAPKEAVIEAALVPVKPQTAATVTMTKRTKLNVLQPATPRIVAKMIKANGVPPMSCDVCSLGTQCPKFEEESACAFNEAFAEFDTRQKEDVVALIHEVATDTKIRYRRAKFIEQRLNGGMPMPEVTRLGKDMIEQQSMLLAFDEQEATVSLSSEGEGEDLIARIFGTPSTEESVELNPAPEPAQLPNPVVDPIVIEEDVIDGSRVVLEG